MSSLKADMESVGHFATEELYPNCMGHLVTKDVREHEDPPWHEGEEDGKDQHPGSKASKRALGQQAVLDSLLKGPKKSPCQDKSAREEQKAENKLEELFFWNTEAFHLANILNVLRNM
jgi:hypothetical protein